MGWHKDNIRVDKSTPRWYPLFADIIRKWGHNPLSVYCPGGQNPRPDHIRCDTGTVELNPGPDTPRKKLSFDVWNLDSLPARDFARIPFIESLQNVNDFDMFGICESMLTTNITNEDVYINGFAPEPFRSDKGPDARNGGVVYILKNQDKLKKTNLCCSFVLPSKHYKHKTQRIFGLAGKHLRIYTWRVFLCFYLLWRF